VRSHYERRDLERLFHIHPRAAQKLMKLVTVGAKVGRSALVDRVVLSDFLDRVAESDDPESTIQAQRSVPSPAPRRKLRNLIQIDCDVATLDTMPANITPRSGELVITFNTLEELAGSLHALAQVLENQLEEFAAKFEPILETASGGDPVTDDLRLAFEELERAEQAKAAADRRA
jgi:hypothetical protein